MPSAQEGETDTQCINLLSRRESRVTVYPSSTFPFDRFVPVPSRLNYLCFCYQHLSLLGGKVYLITWEMSSVLLSMWGYVWGVVNAILLSPP